MAGWVDFFLSGWGGPTNVDLEVGDAIAGGEDIIAGEVHAWGGGPAFESPRLRRKQQRQQKKRVSKSEVLMLGPGDAIASGEQIAIESGATVFVGAGKSIAIAQPIDIAGAAQLELVGAVASGGSTTAIQILGSAELLLESSCAGSESEGVEIFGEHRGMFVIAGDVLRVTRSGARLRVRDDGLVEAA